MMARNAIVPFTGRIQMRKTNHLQIVIFGLQRAAGPTIGLMHCVKGARSISGATAIIPPAPAPARPGRRPYRQITRHGAPVWYVRVGKGPRIRIRAEYGTPEFQDAYQTAIKGESPRPGARAAKGTLGWLFDLYRQTSAWSDLAPSTRYKREKIMMRVLATAGHEPVSAINEAAIIVGRERRAATPASAQAFIDTLHGLFKWAVKSKFAAVDPTLNVKVETKPKRKGGYPPWTDEDMALYEARWPRGTRERLLFDILTYTGLRIGDVARLGRQHVRNGIIRIDTEKTGMRVTIPMLAPLKATIEASQTGDLAYIVTRRGTPWNKGALGTYFSDSAKAAGIRGKSAHGMRKAAATRAADNGATEREMEAIFGWSGGRMATLYTRSANRDRLAAGAIDKLDRRETETGTSIPSPEDKVREFGGKTE
jgi:integrase